MNSATPTNPSRSWTRLDGVDMLRAIAIFFVLMNHVNMRLLISKVPYTAGLPHQLVNSLVWNGQYGVQIFFAVSGFLITSTTLRRWCAVSNVSVRDFYKLRFARIAPLLLLLLTALSVLHLANVQDFVIQATRSSLPRALLAALTFHVNLLEATHGYLPANWDILWSLSVEEMFYLFFPLICLLFGRGKLLIVLLLTFVALGPFARTTFGHGDELWQQYSYFGGMDAIALGCLTAIFLAGRRLTRQTLWVLGIAGVVFLAFILGFSVHAYRWGFGRTGLDMTIIGLGTCMIIVIAAQTKWRSPRIFAPVLALGRRSYEIYLTHMFIVFACLHLFLGAGKPMWAVPVYFVSVVLLSALLGELTARFYSEPMNRYLRKLWDDGPRKIGSVVDAAKESTPRKSIAIA